LDERLALRLFQTTDVVGRQLHLEERLVVGESRQASKLVTIAGVVTHGRVETIEDSEAYVVYLPLGQHPEPSLAILARANKDPIVLTTELLATVLSADPTLTVGAAGTVAAIALPHGRMLQVAASLTAALGVFGILLSLAALYGVLSQVIAARRRELGIRLALGATMKHVSLLVVSDGFRAVLIGVGLGLVFSFAVSVAVRPLFLEQFPSVGAPFWASVAACPVIGGVAACLLAARHVGRITTADLLKSE
jgi:hypothetical protein